MAEVIDLRKRQSREIKVRKARAHRRAQAVASALSCGMCPRRCAHCGMAVEESFPPPKGAPYPFCTACRDEYLDFRRWEEGLRDPGEHYWHTPGWADMWRSWLQHMKANEDFRRSAEFLRLIQEAQD